MNKNSSLELMVLKARKKVSPVFTGIETDDSGSAQVLDQDFFIEDDVFRGSMDADEVLMNSTPARYTNNAQDLMNIGELAPGTIQFSEDGKSSMIFKEGVGQDQVDHVVFKAYVAHRNPDYFKTLTSKRRAMSATALDSEAREILLFEGLAHAFSFYTNRKAEELAGTPASESAIRRSSKDILTFYFRGNIPLVGGKADKSQIIKNIESKSFDQEIPQQSMVEYMMHMQAVADAKNSGRDDVYEHMRNNMAIAKDEVLSSARQQALIFASSIFRAYDFKYDPQVTHSADGQKHVVAISLGYPDGYKISSDVAFKNLKHYLSLEMEHRARSGFSSNLQEESLYSEMKNVIRGNLNVAKQAAISKIKTL